MVLGVEQCCDSSSGAGGDGSCDDMTKLEKFGLCHCTVRFREHRRNLVEDVESLVRAQITDVMVLMLVRL